MSAPVAKGHSRLTSTDERRRVAITRRPTVGPLDDDVDDPLSQKPNVDATSVSSTRLPTSLPPRSPIPRTTRESENPTPTLDNLPAKDLSFLLDPAIFHPIPVTSIPQPFLSSSNAGSLHTPLETLLANGQHRLAALHCARELSEFRDSTAVSHILSLFHTRLACLTLLSHHELAAQESKALGDVASSFYRHPLSGDHLLPWALRVLCVRLTAIGYGEWRKGIMGYYELAREARIEIAKSREASRNSDWPARLQELGIVTANLLVEMGDLECAAEHLATLPGYQLEETTGTSQLLRTMEAFVWLRIGDIAAAKVSLGDAEDASATLQALLQMAEDDYEGAIKSWQIVQKKDPGNAAITQNLAVCLLYQGRLPEAREQLESLVKGGHSFNSLTFNLATVYELSTEKARDKKLQLAEQIASRKPVAMTPWERMNTDFKL